MPELSSLTRPKPTDVRITLDEDDTINLVFDRNRVTPAWVAEAQAAAEKDALALSKALAHATISWDVTNDGQPFPPTGENIGVLSYGAQKVLLEEIMRAAVPGAAEGNASANTSPTPSTSSMPSPETLQNGQDTSLSPAPLASPSPT